jgi:hypothetical protein
VACWCSRSEMDATYFPYSVNYVARLYFRFRKRNEEEIRDFRREIEDGRLW